MTNDGNVDLQNVKVTDELTGDSWTIDKLAVGASQTFTASYVVTEADAEAGSVKNVATGTAEDPEDPDNPYDPEEPGTDEEPTVVPVDHDPPVKKVITGNKPSSNSTFTFKLEAKSNTAGLSQMPLPNGASGTSVTTTTTGAEEKEFGVITFDKEGVYVYEVSEENTGEKGYTYDGSVYTLTYTITLNKEAGKYEKELVVTKDGEAYDKSYFEFTNKYTKSTGGSSTKTGVEDRWPMYLGGAVLLVLAALGILLYYRKKKSD